MEAVDVPKHNLRFPQLENMFVALQDFSLAAYPIPIDLRAKFRVLVFQADLRAGMDERLEESDRDSRRTFTGRGSRHRLAGRLQRTR